MNPFLFLAIFCLGVTSAAPTLNHTLDAQWKEWKTKHNKTYSTDEEGQRRAVWEENLKMIELHNEECRHGKHGFTMEMNAFGDLTTEEFKQARNGFQRQRRRMVRVFQELEVKEIPKSVDWREKGFVTPVKNQGRCNACWAFSAVGALEGQMFKKTGKLVSLSEQNLVDCSRPQRNVGCRGGRMDFAFRYVQQNGGLDTEESYPYEARDGPCRYNPEHSAANATGEVHVPPNEEALAKAVATVGPISVALDASHNSFKFYRGGIYYEPKCNRFALDHGVLVVGYGFEGEESENRKYWLIKNSWGKNWGLNGYAKIARDRDNHCGIATWISYPIV
ncbi:procathepsin L-like isoform X1 [Castor canadensis]|uniref:procathepsin L-like isoform X1 n=1 Tax=Castor canadensis TaxID=51338 RepID=UPI003D16D06B